MGPAAAELLLTRYQALSPLWGVHCKLRIGHLRSLPPTVGGGFLLGGRVAGRAEVVGFVVRRDEREGRLMFVVDDATGLLEVLVWQKRFEREQSIDWEKIQLGELVRVRGRVTRHRDAPQMSLSSMEVLAEGSEGLAEEMEHWREASELRETVYAEGSGPPEWEGTERVMEEKRMLERALAKEPEPETAGECLAAVFVLLSEVPNGVAAEEDLGRVLRVRAGILREALTDLCDNGGAYWEEDRPATVAQIRPEENLGLAMLEIVREMGPVNAADLMEELRRDYRWRCVRGDQTEAALAHLCAESHIFNDGEGVYKVMTD